MKLDETDIARPVVAWFTDQDMPSHKDTMGQAENALSKARGEETP